MVTFFVSSMVIVVLLSFGRTTNDGYPVFATSTANYRALWNEVWSSLRFDDDLRPLVDSSYQRWIRRLTTLVREARAEGSIDAATDPRETAWRLAALADGIDSMLYLELLGRARARTLLREGVRRELGL